jgi:hypothetical protein
LDRKRAARAAARLIYFDLLQAQGLALVAIAEGGWWTAIDATPLLERWFQRSEAMAQTLGLAEFLQVSGTYVLLQNLSMAREAAVKMNPAEPKFEDRHAKLALELMPEISKARDVLHRASLSASDRRKHTPLDELGVGA